MAGKTDKCMFDPSARDERSAWWRTRLTRAILILKWGEMGQSMSALPGISDLDLLRESEGIVHLDPEVAYGAFDSRVPEQELHGA